MKKKVYILSGTILIGIVVFLLIGKALLNMDRVDSYYRTFEELPFSALTWIDFQKNDLMGAKDISLHTDIDVNDYIFSWKFSTAEQTNKFIEVAKSKNSQVEAINCHSKEIACNEFGDNPNSLLKITFPHTSNVHESVFVLIDVASMRVLGSNRLPLPPHLK